MTLADYQNHLKQLPFGKKLPTAVYVYWAEGADFGHELNLLVSTLAARHGLGTEFNLIKFRVDELKISFLSYPDFLVAAHPALRRSVTVDLVTGKVRRTDYVKNLNPPILHRKETFLPADHPEWSTFAALTRAEEDAWLYEQTATIGFKLNWERLLAAKGLRIEGHAVLKVESVKQNAERANSTNDTASGLRPFSHQNGEGNLSTKDGERGGVTADTVLVERHKTALTRYELSKPVKTLLEYGLLKANTTFFDYGCGQGSDVRGLQALGHQAKGWDPVHQADGNKHEADIVNLGYVLNVIEDPAERLEALVDAHQHCRKLLVVSALIKETVDVARARQYSDGVLTRANTFQKFFEQQELQQYIEDALETTAVPVALGVFYVFRNPAEQQDFLSARNRRTIDWTQISARLGLGGPQSLWKALYEAHKEMLDEFGKTALALGRFPDVSEFASLVELTEKLGSTKRAIRAFIQGGGSEQLDWNEVRMRFGIGLSAKRRWEVLCDEHRELLDAFWSRMLQLGRLPEAEEFPRVGELREKIGSPKQALRLFIQKGGGDDVRLAAENRKRDLLVYVALANLRKRVPFGHLSASLRADIRAFFGNYAQALKQGVDLLYAAGDTGEIELACENLKVGWQDEQALYLHRGLLDQLPPVLRAYVGCATALFGDVAQADVIKLHKESGKATFLVYDDFEGKPLPKLLQRIKVNLRTRWVQVFDHSAEQQLLYFKERFVSATHPGRTGMESLSAKLRKLGFDEGTIGRGPLRPELDALLATKGLNADLNPLRTKTRKS